MLDRILEIIAIVMGEIKKSRSLMAIDMGKLLKEGYTKSEIYAAISWIADKAPDKANKEELFFQEASEESFRAFHDSEKELFTEEAFNVLIQYKALGLLENSQIEGLIDKSIFAGQSLIEGEEVRRLIAYNLFKHNLDLPPGYRFTLMGNETIH